MDLYNNVKLSLENRMKKNVDKFNSGKFHYFKPYIVSIKSRQILSFLNNTTSFDSKIKDLEMFQNILYETSKELYIKFDPNLIYTFQDEIHLVFFYNDNGNYMYDGNINKIITTIASFASISVFKQLQKKGIELEFSFNSKFVEFDKDFETLNYLVWRQNDCKRNIISLLYKCLHVDLFLENNIDLNVKLDHLKDDINKILNTDIEISLIHLLRGNIIKKHKQIVDYLIGNENDTDKNQNKENEENETVTRNIIHIEHFLFADNFDKIFKKYIKNKVV